MKKLVFILSIISIFFLTGCFKKDTLENINIYTSAYPIEYITTKLYGEHSTIKSIYPDGTNINHYELNQKQLHDYSQSDMYIFNGLSKEQSYLISMVEKNKRLMMIDSTQSMEITSNLNELWLDPSNVLMMASNIKKGLLEYIQNVYLTTEIQNNYDELKVSISKLDASLKLLSENNNNPTIIVDNSALKFLEKYGFTVICLEESDALTQKTISDATNLIEDNKITYIFTLDKENLNKTVKEVEHSTKAKIAEFKDLSNLTNKERSEKEDYISLMTYNINLLKNEIYD